MRSIRYEPTCPTVPRRRVKSSQWSADNLDERLYGPAGFP